MAKQTTAEEKAKELATQKAQIAIEKGEAEVALADALPALEAAAEALNSLKKDEITEIRSFAKPNIYVQKVVMVHGRSKPKFILTNQDIFNFLNICKVSA